LEATTGDAGNQLGGKLVDAGGSVLTATARHGMPGFWSCELLRVVLLRNVGENSSMLG